MGRWEPNAGGRLARAALVLSAEKGYEATTVAEIAAAAGVTERTFYRYFPDKADAVFPDNRELLVVLAGVVEDASRTGQSPLDAALVAVHRLATYASEEPERARLSAMVIPSVPALAGRELVRQRQTSEALSGGLAAAGVPRLEAQLAAESALAVWRVAVAEWARDNWSQPLPEVVTATAEAARTLNRG
ncbi:MAG: TetR family transcriptional regulator [Actinobacteria bacterium]|nr:TetR family transcriptional regulator [Actinomycetota bacterium]